MDKLDIQLPALMRFGIFRRYSFGGALLCERLALVIVALVAAGFRLYQLSEAPPGLHHDEAVNGLDILVNIPRSHPIFFEANNGREPLFIYLQAVAVYLLGPTVLALRLTSAIVGIATVLATYWLAREWFGRRVALLAGLGLATSFWHVDLSRVGLRAIAAPLFLTLALGLLWRGLRRGQMPSFALAGVGLGLALYTYLSARFAPVLCFTAVAWEGIRNWRQIGYRRMGLVVFVVVFAIVVAPLGAYFAAHADFFIGRAGQVSIFNPNPTIEGEPSTFRDSLLGTLGMFFVRGDENPRHNLPNRPLFDPVTAPWLLIGLCVALWRAVNAVQGRPPSYAARGILAGPHPVLEATDTRRRVSVLARDNPGVPTPLEPAGWLLLWLIIMLAPGVLTHESPNFLRLTALAPAVYVTWGLGVVATWELVSRRLRPTVRVAPALVGILALALVGYEASRTYRDYFAGWKNRADVYQAFDSGLTAAAKYVEASAGPKTELVFYVDRSPVVQFLSPASRRGRWLHEYSNLLPLPTDTGRDAIYVFAGDGILSRGPQIYFSTLRPDGFEAGPDGRAGFTAYRLTSEQVRSLSTPAVPYRATFGDSGGQVELLGYTLDAPTTRPGERLGVTLLWRQRVESDVVYAPYVHVVDLTGRSWGQDDRLGYMVGGWQPGDLFISRHEWTVPADAPPMAYRVRAGMATRDYGPPPGPSEAIGSAVDLAEVRTTTAGVIVEGQPLPSIAHEVHADMGAHLELVGHDTAAPSPLQPGDTVTVDLLWYARQAPARDVLVTLRLVDAEGHTLVEATDRPVYGQYSTSRWPAHTILRDPRALTLPASVPGGVLRLEVETTDASTSQHLGQATLGTVEVVVPPRNFDLPPMEERVDANFGGEISLRGYDLERIGIGSTASLHLTLYWQALQEPSRNYTVFTHLLDAANRIVAQQDNPPARGTMPTLGWLPFQVVRDEYNLELPSSPTSDVLTLAVGLYDPTTGERLALADRPGDQVILTRVDPNG